MNVEIAIRKRLDERREALMARRQVLLEQQERGEGSSVSFELDYLLDEMGHLRELYYVLYFASVKRSLASPI